MKPSPVLKISLSGLLISLTIIFTRFFAIQNIPIIPFVRISLGPSLIIFASIYLGPIYGGIIGGVSDILGILLIPNSLGYQINPLLTLVYTILGIVPWVFYRMVKSIKSPQMSIFLFSIIMIIFWVVVLILTLVNSSITLGNNILELSALIKVLIIVISFVLCVGIILAIFYTNKFIKKRFPDEDINTYSVAFSCLVSEILVIVILNSLVKSFIFGIDYIVIVAVQLIVLFIDVPLNSLVSTYLLLLLKRVTHNRLV